MGLWSWTELAAAVDGISAEGGTDVDGISIDSRSLRPGDLFIALSGDPGPRFRSSFQGARDGHEFVASAADAGAAGALVHRDVTANLPVLRVADTLDGLWRLAGAARTRARDGRFVAITGSSGKTTARHIIETILSAEAVTHASEASLNNHWGVPLSLARMPRDTAYGVYEVGMNHPGEIAPLARLVAPHVALVLNVHPAHLGNFDSLAAIREEKLSLRDGLVEDGVLVVPESLAVAARRGERVVTFGFARAAQPGQHVRILDVREGERWLVTVSTGQQRLRFELSPGGRHRVHTAVAALATILALGADVAAAAEAIGTVAPLPGRGGITRIADITVVDDSYNANPASMAAALKLLLESAGGRKIAILGDMLELGERGPGLHRDLARLCVGLDGVVAVGPLMAELYSALAPSQRWRHAEGSRELSLGELVAGLRAGDTVLVKGSKKMLWQRGVADRLIAEVRRQRG